MDVELAPDVHAVHPGQDVGLDDGDFSLGETAVGLAGGVHLLIVTNLNQNM